METKLKEIRKLRCMTQAELAQKAGINRVTVARYELGVSVPGTANLVKLADALNVSTEELIVRKAG
jgi:transcriptional regulator with XRE-family HTH domain